MFCRVLGTLSDRFSVYLFEHFPRLYVFKDLRPRICYKQLILLLFRSFKLLGLKISYQKFGGPTGSRTLIPCLQSKNSPVKLQAQ